MHFILLPTLDFGCQRLSRIAVDKDGYKLQKTETDDNQIQGEEKEFMVLDTISLISRSP